MILLRGTRAKVRPALASLRRTISQQQEHYIDMQQDLHQKEIHLKVIGSIISLTIFMILLFATTIAVPIILIQVEKRWNCPETTSRNQFPTSSGITRHSFLTIDSNPNRTHPFIHFEFEGSVQLCTAGASWNPRGITVAGGLPTTSLSGLQYPYDIYVYDNGTILVADYGNNRITKWDPGATVSTLIAGTGSYGSWSTLLARPVALAVRGDQLYVSDLENYRIQVFSLDDNLSPPEAVTLIGRYGRGSNTNQINQVTNIIVPASTPSLLYMADSKNHRILLWNSDLNYTLVVAGTSGIFGSNSTLLYNPLGITLDEKTNSLYIADSNNSRIQKYNMNTQNPSITTVAGWGQLNNPYAVQLDPSGINMFISDTFNHRILVWLNGSLQGRIIAGNGIAGNNDTQLNSPAQIRFDSNYNLYVVDTNNSRIQRFDLISNGC